MNREIKPDYSQTFVLPPALEDWVDENHPARLVREFVESLDLGSMGFRQTPQTSGRPRFSDELLLKVWILGYMNDIRSSRKLERACREMMGFVWLTAMNAPDHNTLWRFFKRNGCAIRKVFVQTALSARKAGFAGMRVHAVDGTKIRGRGSADAVLKKEDLNRALAEAEARIAEYMQDVSGAQESETGQYRLPDELSDAVKRKEWIEEQLKQMRDTGQKTLHATDPESRLMKCSGRHHPAYNAQAVVDVDSGLVVAADVTDEQNDMHQLVPMTRQVKENLGENAEETLADGGYVTLSQLGQVDEDGTEVGVALPGCYVDREGDSPFHASHFEFDDTNDVVMCPMGKTLKPKGTKKARREDYRFRVFRCTQAATCPRRAECCPGKAPREITVSPFHSALENQRRKHRDPEKRRDMHRHRTRVETLFGNVKNNSGFHRFTAWGIEAAKAQWALICVAENLKKALNAKRRHPALA